MAAAVVAPFVLASLFPIVDAIPLERRGNSTASRGFDGPTQFGPWTVPFWAYILIVGLIITASMSLLVFLVKFFLSIPFWTLCSSVDTLLAEKVEKRQDKQAHQTHTQPVQPQPQPQAHQTQTQQPHQHQRPQEHHSSPIHPHGVTTGVYDHSHIRTYSTHSNSGAYAMNQPKTGNIAPYHQYTLPSLPGAGDPYPQRRHQHQNYQHQHQHQQQQYPQQQYQIKRARPPEAFAFPLVPASMVPLKPPPPSSPLRVSSRPSSELDPIVQYPPMGFEHKYSASH